MSLPRDPKFNNRDPLTFNFTYPSPLIPFAIPAQAWITRHTDTHITNLCANVAVFNPQNHILLVQRAAHDTWMPNRWELPGGSAELQDQTILHGAARELWEETGLVATRFTRFIPENAGPEGGYAFRDEGRGVSYCRFAFEVEVESCEGVVLDPREHQWFSWVSEEEVRGGGVGEWITDEMMRRLILEAFRLRSTQGEK